MRVIKIHTLMNHLKWGVGFLFCFAPVCAAPVLAQEPLFSDALILSIDDGVLDRDEYRQLKQHYFQNSALPGEEQRLSKHFFKFISKHKQFIKINYGFYKGSQQNPVRLDFVFAPNYTENDQVPGKTWQEVLSHISQNDTLTETQQDSYRCGAAALLGARFLLKQDFASAFELLRVPLQAPRPTYREMHLAQEQLYNYANTDGSPGLVSAVRYVVYSDGRIAKPVSEGEIQRGADLLQLNLEPLIGSTRSTLYRRKDVVLRFWRKNPQAVLLIGVYLDEKSGEIYPPSKSKVQNHFILVFRQNSNVFLVNSGVSDNGGGKAIRQLNSTELNAFVFSTQATLQGATLRSE
ncbi:hypothetical protein COW36_15030 [bacterium (Candidatus Blackallbacteria) CG17_big_fil_post_rev_8_21_14_2_50_48_46]|uniref:Peptidase C39-like domain-containing protein n=1 Tax=bacterium (Candidatus Blackallbacteria) CG17_big_fil_post_rev_8_21_14_2_50_48_46 TaxID=2014261 RepID=A0A2M7G2K6_9BACT|nr:MAG: hypothetical protein COW64_11520 [bacterium (Candidatus Blackallbacteria) CG18_big_fil_WC_8_21_14_2_50_49_26]PIW16023.1 MAG: hypothetical protein COW36_15030 [bacterium (Candidatus Blackallbacteria) CG17_big_fil_post_rev_8_21_14_2_50_48_46]PIW50435.1 MAG: hypothetical protein COW20_02745 [bacterium (Candidatus Blackallbacteria) CG13_big_fil_rev_8_21_14_2_50_49_14]